MSCADLRWDENFAAILRDKECTLVYKIEEEHNGYPKTVIYVEQKKDTDGNVQLIPIKTYIEENIEESLHECIRGDVLLALTKKQRKDSEGKYTEPFKGVTNAFKKFRTGGELTNEEEIAMINFIDEYTTVSLCADEVGEEVAKIVEEVNKHHHTKTCKPFPKCRFRYPKFPVWKTILVKPYKSKFQEETEHYLKKYAETLKKVLKCAPNKNSLRILPF